MTIYDKSRLKRLFSPKSIVIYGGVWADVVAAQNKRLNFHGTIYRIHPTQQHCLRSIDEIQGDIDAVFLGVNSDITIEEVKKLSARGCGGAVCFASGFKEVEATRHKSKQLIEAAGNMPFIGANCYGFINYFDQCALFPDQVPYAKHIGQDKTGVALITQSGTLAITLISQRRHLPVGYAITLGNQEGIRLDQAIDYVLDDARVTAIGLYIEHIPDIASFIMVAEKAKKKNIPITVIKIGRSNTAQKTALTHTGSLSGSDILYDAFLRRLAISRVDNLSSFTELLKFNHYYGSITDNNIFVSAVSGGDIGVAADVADAYDVTLGDFTHINKNTLTQYAGGPISAANPLDFSTYNWYKPQKMQDMFTYIFSDVFSVYALIIDPPDDEVVNIDSFIDAITSFCEAVKCARSLYAHPIRAVLVSSMADNLSPNIRFLLQSYHILHSGGLPEFFEAVAQSYHAGKQAFLRKPICHFAKGAKTIYDEYTAKQYLGQHHLPIPKHILCHNTTDIYNAYKKLGANCALKICGAEFLHKTESGGVFLHVDTPQKLEAAITHLQTLNGAILVEEMLPKPLFELMIGIEQDADFGHYMVINAGGIYAEIYPSSFSLLFPITADTIIDKLKNAGITLFYKAIGAMMAPT